MLKLDGKTLQYDRAFTHNQISYPANWLRLTTLEEKQAIGIVEVPDPPVASWDQRFYWGPDNPKDHAGLVELWVTKTKETAGSLISPTDWYVTRNAENGSAIPQEVLDRRAEVRTFSNQKESAIEATSTTEELAEYVTSPAYSAWTEIVIEEPEVETIIGSEGEDSLVFSSRSTTSGFSTL